MTEKHEEFTALDMIGAVAAGFAILACLSMLFVVPTFARMFEDFSAALPIPTVLVIQRWPIVLAALLSGGLLLVGALGLGIPSLLVRRLMVLGSFCVGALTVLFTLGALYLPVIEMTQTVTYDEPVSVDLPTTRKQTLEDAPSVTIAIDRDGTIYFDGGRVQHDTVRLRLCSLAADAPDSQVVIAADDDTPHATVIEVMDLAKQCGLSRLALATEASEPEPEPAPER